jgi:hypothetical protein
MRLGDTHAVHVPLELSSLAGGKLAADAGRNGTSKNYVVARRNKIAVIESSSYDLASVRIERGLGGMTPRN